MNQEIVILTIGILGSLASIIGSLISIRNAKKASNSADIAEMAKKEVMNRKSNSDLSTILADCKRVQHTYLKYRLDSKTRSLDGVNYEQDIEDLQRLLLKLNENRSLIETIDVFKFSAFYKKMNRLINEFSVLKSIEDLKPKGVEIMSNMDEIISALRTNIDEYSTK